MIKLTDKLIKEVEGLREENAIIKERLVQLEYGRKSSENSSLPPAFDSNRKRETKKKNTTTGRKAGGQTGHKRSFLKKVETPDHTIEYHLKG